MNQYKIIPHFFPKALSAVTCIALLSACDPDAELESQVTDSDWIDLDAPIGSADERAESTLLVAEVEVGDGRIMFYDESWTRDGVEEVVVGIGFTGGGALGALRAYDEQDATALEIFLAVAPDAQVPEVLQREHDLLAEAGKAEVEPRDFSDIQLFRDYFEWACFSSDQWLDGGGLYNKPSWDDWSAGYMPSGENHWGPFTTSAFYFYTDYSTARALGGCNHWIGQTGYAGVFQIHWRANASDSWHSVDYFPLGQNQGYYYRSSGTETRQYRGWLYHTGGQTSTWYANAAW